MSPKRASIGVRFAISSLLLGIAVVHEPIVDTSAAADWPMWRYDAGRTASSPAGLPDKLHLQWSLQFAPRETVWDDPLNQDLMPYDQVFEPIVVGKTMLVGFNDSDKLVAFNTETGQERWRVYTDGPVRLPPAANDRHVYFTSDDGYLYCAEIKTGKVLWRFRGGPSDRKVIGNRRLISTWPARGGPVLMDDTVYWAASIWPMMGTFIYALDANTGRIEWVNDGTSAQYIQQPHNYPAFAGVAPQGPLVATDDKLLLPGGRSVPACFDRHTGKSLYYHLARYGKWGGSSVFAANGTFYGHERDGFFNGFDLESGHVRGGVRGHQPILSGDSLIYSGEQTAQISLENPKQAVWQLDIDSSGDLIRAGDRIYAAGGGKITALQLKTNADPQVAWTHDVAGDVQRLIAADNKLLAVTKEGQILAFGSKSVETAPRKRVTGTLQPSAAANQKARRILDEANVRDGYALFYGISDEQLLQALVLKSQLKIVAVDPDAETIDKLRRLFDEAGLYGDRIALHIGDIESFPASRYMSSLTIVADQKRAGLTGNAQAMAPLFESVRPYGGKLLAVRANEDGEAAANLARIAEKLYSRPLHSSRDGWELITRDGPLPGAGSWTHQYGNIANTIKSDDSRVQLPLGILWFGGSSNMDVLPRHGHGPPEQVIGGRLFIQGMDSLSARDVYTGRIIWKVPLENLNTFGVFYDETYHNSPLSLDYNQVHIPGANVRGTNFVATLDRVYIIQDDVIRMLDSATGKTVGTIPLPETEAGAPSQSWGYIGVYEDVLIGGTGFADFSNKLGMPHQPAPTDKKSKWRFTDYDKSASNGLVVMDRYTGKVLWQTDAVYGFIHNSVVADSGMLYCLDKLPPNLEKRLARRGQANPSSYRLLALDIQTGEIQWQKNDNIFGTWLSVSAPHGVLLQSTRPSSDTVADETGTRMIAYQANDGNVIWDKPINYRTPPILHGDDIITGGKRYNLRTGEVRFRLDPITGKMSEWSYVSTKGCNYPIACEHLITFRSSAAAFYDLEGDGGTGHFGGFKSGCTSNLIAADGVLNAPDYTRTCRCSFQNQTSLALVHMPGLEIWTHNDFRYDGDRVDRVGVNFGAPGDRRDEQGTLWLEHPGVGAPSPKIAVDVSGNATFHRHHSSRYSGDAEPWIAASAVEGAEQIVVHLTPPPPKVEPGINIRVVTEEDDAEEDSDGKIDLGSSDLELTEDDGLQTIGMRFQKVRIPQGAKIRTAYLQFQVDETSDDPTYLQVFGEAADNSHAFSKDQFDLTSRKRTNVSFEWQPKPWEQKDEAGIDQRTGDLSAVIQEIVDREGWKPGNAMTILISGEGDRTAEAYDGDKKAATLLHIELEDPSLVTQHADATSRTPIEPRRYTVRLYFAEPDEHTTTGQRVFSVAIGEKVVLEDFDILEQTGAAQQTIVKEFSQVSLSDELVIGLTSKSSLPAIMSGVEVIAEDAPPR